MRKLLTTLPRFRRAAAELPVLAERESWTRSAIETFQLERLNKVWEAARIHVPYYRALADQRSLPSKFCALDQFRHSVPRLSKASVREANPALLTNSPGKGHWQRTSGSTGTPLKTYRDTEGHQESLRAKYRFHQVWGLGIADPMAWLWSSDAVSSTGLRGQVQSAKQMGIDYLRNRLRLPASRLRKTDLQTHLRRIQAFKPSGFYGYSRATHLLAREASTSRLNIDGLSVVILTGEAASDAIIETVSHALNAPVAMEYGCVEFGYIAGTYPDGTLRVREDVVLLETSPREDGRYDLLLTTLNNPSFPLLRYEVGDVTDQPLIMPESGFAILPEVSGRDDDLILTRSGGVIDATTIDSIFESEHFKTVRRYRIHQSVEGDLTVHIEPIDRNTLPERQAIRQRIGGLIDGFDVDVRIVEQIAQTDAGKHRVVTSDYCRQENAAGV